MKPTRLEAFSDGVIAIIITIMVLELKVPPEPTLEALRPLLPILLSYALSFTLIAIYWVNHHHLIHLASRVTGPILWRNVNLLFWLSLTPFTTGFMGENHAAALPVALYGVVQVACSVSFLLLRKGIARQQSGDPTLAALHDSNTRKNLLAIGLMAASVPLAFVSVPVSLFLVVLPAVMYFLPDRRAEAHARTIGALALLGAMSAGPLAAQQWHRCDLRAAGDAAAECAQVPVPLDHARPAGPRLFIAVKRIPAIGTEQRQLWFVDGGPGDAGRASLGSVAGIVAGDSGLAIYTFDHRGVGESGPLECPEQRRPSSPDGAELTPKEWPACIATLKATRRDLQYISVDQAAQDLALLVERFRRPGASTVVWGVSYGTFLVWQYLRHATHRPDGVIADGIVPPDWSFAEFDANLDAMGRTWLGECAGDSSCRARLGDDPVAFARGAAGSLGTGPCRELGLTPAMYRLVLGNLLMAGDPIRRLIPVVAYRVRRCNGWDRSALGTMVAKLFESGAVGEKASHNPIAQRHLALSSLWRDSDPPADQLERALDTVLMTTGVSASLARSLADWPRAPGPVSREVPAYDGPMLLLHGDHDPTMPVERLAEVRRRYSGASQSFMVVPWAGHVTVNENPCVRSIYRAFLRGPAVAPDQACLRGLTRPAMLPDAALARRTLGTSDVWGDRWPGWLYPALMTTIYLGAPLLLIGLLWRWRSARKAG